MGEVFHEVIFYKKYFLGFVDEQSIKVAKKIFWTIDLIRHARFVPEPYMKSIEGVDGLSEIRVIFGGDIFRIFCFFDDGKLIILANGFQKKTQKTPQREIDRALRIKDEYYAEKGKH